jgi:hypothetical protein
VRLKQGLQPGRGQRAGQRLARAGVHAVAEAEHAAPGAHGHEAVGLGVEGRVAVGRGQQHQHRVAGGQRASRRW